MPHPPRHIYCTACWHCHRYIYVFHDGLGGVVLFDEKGGGWPKHHCDDGLVIAIDQVKRYESSPAQKLRRIRSEAAERKRESACPTHVLLAEAEPRRSLLVAGAQFCELRADSPYQEEVYFFVPQKLVKVMKKWTLVEIVCKCVVRGGDKLFFLDEVTPFFEESKRFTSLAPREIEFRESIVIQGRLRPRR